MPVHVVPPSNVVTYLQEKRADGYSIVGLEQTSKSQSLANVSFPEKVCCCARLIGLPACTATQCMIYGAPSWLQIVLVLGAEKEGIPVEVIQELDIVVEIPQFGVIRSLNVHVSGALLVWQYTAQRLLRQQIRDATA